MALNHFVASFVLLLFFSSCALQAQASIIITSNAGSSVWWLAFAVSDTTTTAVELKDSGSYSSWTPLTATNWGYWTFGTTGNAVTFPISFRLSQGSNQLIVNNAFTNAAPGTAYDTKQSFPAAGTSTQPTTKPTTAPATAAPTTKPTTAPATAAPTTKPTTAPATAAPTTKPTTAPATAAPTTKPTTAPATAAPTTKPTSAPATAAPTTKPTSAPTAAPTTKPATAAPTTKPATGNPFSGTYYYLNPQYSIEIDSSIAANPSKSTTFSKVKNMATAYWLDTMSKIDNLTTILTQARQQASTSAAGGKSVLVTLVVYDLPSRDCAAGASNGEISCADATCAAGISKYKTSYIDKLVSVLRNFPDLTIAAIIEPDSLPNLATNLGYPKCALAQTAYTTCVAYAIQQLSALGNVHNYIDAAHGGWLGWDSGRNAFVTVVNQVLTAAGGKSKIRGFATNVANYQPLGSMTDTTDPCNLGSQYNFAINEVKYANLLDQSFIAAGITGMYYIIDTGRNGVPNSRTSCSNWCNIAKAGFGQPPSSNTAASGLSNIDAYFWIKPGGESDGTSDATSGRYDATCSSVDSMVPAPQAGEWFSNYFASLATNANPAL